MIHSDPRASCRTPSGGGGLPGLDGAELAGALASAEAEKAELERQLSSLLRCLAGLFYRCELQAPWRMSFISEGVEALTGFEAAELGEGWARIVFPLDRAAIEKTVGAAIEAREPFELTYRIVHASGELRWVTERGHAVCDEGGTPLFLEGVITDVSGRKQAEEIHRTLLGRWRTTLDTIPQMVWTMAGDGSDPFYNSQWLKFLGRPVGEEHGANRLDLVHPEDREMARLKWKESFETGAPYEAQYRLKHRSGGYRWVLSRAHAELDADGRPLRWHGSCTDVHDHVLAREALQISEAVNRSMIEATPDCISLLDLDGNIRFVNASVLSALGLASSEALIGRPWAHAFPPSARGPARLALSHAQAGRLGHFSAAQRSPSGDRWWDVILAPIRADGGAQTGILAIARDITHQKTAEERVKWAGNHDALTHLPNRALFQRGLDQSLSASERSGDRFSVLMIDLDDFKRTNDALGHDAGDALLTEFSRRLRRAVREDDLVARLGGDEFAVLLDGVGAADEIEAAVAAILCELKTPFVFEGRVLDIRASIGASSYPDLGSSRSELLKHADIALYVAKASGRGVLRIFEPAMRAETQDRMSMLALARDSLAQHRIVPFYQPKVDLRSGRLEGFEALLRWRHPTDGIQTPDTISAAFEDVTLAAEISDRMIDLVIADLRDWTDRGVEFGHVAVNAAAAEFRTGDFAERLLDRLARAGLSPTCLQLEVTETVFLGRGAEHVENALRLLSSHGVRIALDDFGTGHASLSHLSRFPVDVLKIDKSFITDLEPGTHDAAIVRAVINLGRSLGIGIVAEGIETQAQADRLKRLRCHSGQGYLFGRAAPAAAVPEMIERLSRAEAPHPRF